ncbi:hypothetical protein FB645_001493 [Coemansia sp. IMI 203386]|nr:hypothetical protein FB645_001493 [Coemansia sp. IMI 203386]
MQRLYQYCALLSVLSLVTKNTLCQGYAGSSDNVANQEFVNSVDRSHRHVQYQEKLQMVEDPGDVKTITRVIFVGDPATTQAVYQSICLSENNGIYQNMASSSSQDKAQKTTATLGWAKILIKPVVLTRAILSSTFTFVLKPAWLVAAWVARVLLFRPAVFIYLLFLERPFQALLAFVLWILPLLAFVTAVTLVAILIGGSFGWISAIAIGVIDTSTRAEPQQQNDEGDKETDEKSGPQKVKLLFEQPYRNDSSRESLSNNPEMWSRRRRTKQDHTLQ